MKKAFIRLLPVLALAAFSACNHSRESHQGHDIAVQLDANGQRWAANPETTAGIAKMQSILASYQGRTEAAARQAMRAELEAAFKDIFAQCTMTGEAHDQLHNYLYPMKDIFANIETSDEALSRLDAHLAAYGKYFQ